MSRWLLLGFLTWLILLAGCSSSNGGPPDGATALDGGEALDGGAFVDGGTTPTTDGGTVATSDGGANDGGVACVVGTGASASVVIGPDGGTLALEGLTLEIPAGALTRDTTIGIKSGSECPPSGNQPLTPIFDLMPTGLQFGMPITARYQATGSFPMDLMWQTTFGDYGRSGSNASGNTVTGQANHFSGLFARFFGADPRTDQLSIEPDEIDSGESARLIMTVPFREIALAGCESSDWPIPLSMEEVPAHTDPSGGNVPRYYRVQLDIAPTQTRTYLVNCGRLTYRATITVRQPPLLTLVASPSRVPRGEQVQVAWMGQSALSGCRVYPFNRAVERTGSEFDHPTADTTYEVHCTGPRGQVVRRATATVCTQLQGVCSAESECCAGRACVGSKCCERENGSCTVDADCCAGRCQSGHCRSTCTPPQGACSAQADCCVAETCDSRWSRCCMNSGGRCATSNDCCEVPYYYEATECTSNRCCNPPGSPRRCMADADCCAPGTCNSSYCCGRPRATCSADADCCRSGIGKYVCQTSQCCGGAEASCGAAGDCCPGKGLQCIYGGICCVPLQGTCTTDTDCCATSGTPCTSGKCCRPARWSCNSNEECCSGQCPGGTPTSSSYCQ